MKISLDRGNRTACLSLRTWSQTIPVDELPSQLKFYRGLWARKQGQKFGSEKIATPGPCAQHYEKSLRALEAAVREVSEWNTK